MIKYLQKGLGKLGELEAKYFIVFLIIVLALTGITGIGITRLEFQSDLSEMDPQDIPVMKLDRRIGEEFSSFSTIVVVVELDDELELENPITDIRDPRVMEFLVRLQRNLNEEQKIQSVTSAGMIFQQGVPPDLEAVKFILSQVPESENFFNKGYSVTPVFISADVGADEEKVTEIVERVKEIIEASSPPGGVRVEVTGEPPLISAIFRLMLEDGLFTLVASTVLIFILLLIMQKSLKNSIIIILPPLVGLFWTMGALGWSGTPVTIATAAGGALLLGLGIEYSIFLTSRYREERAKYKVKQALREALSTTGASTVSSGATTMIGFFALMLSVFPILSDMGFTFGIGIFLILASTILTGPVVLLIEEKFYRPHVDERRKLQKESFLLPYFEKYGRLLSRRPLTIIILALLATGFVFLGISQIKSEDIEFDNTLPQDMPELVAYQTLQDEFPGTSAVTIFIELDPSEPGTNLPKDIRDPEIINYINVLSEKSKTIYYVESVRSISEEEKKLGEIPQTLAEQKNIMERVNYRRYVTSDFSGTIILIDMNLGLAEENNAEIVRQVREIIENTEKPAGVKTQVTGGVVIGYELDQLLGPDSSFTALVAFGAIIVFLFLLTYSIKYTVLPLVTVIIAIVWVLGLIGYLQVPFNSVISSVISMTIGIGIDFGIQLSMRFKQELEDKDKKEAMTQTLKYTLYPMVITVIAALIGFRAMTLGQLKLLGDLGNTLSFGIVSSMIVAITVVAGLMVILQKDNKYEKNNKERQNNKNK